jgi:hypothetical protein
MGDEKVFTAPGSQDTRCSLYRKNRKAAAVFIHSLEARGIWYGWLMGAV